MRGEKLELVRGSGNVFRDLGRENADIEQLKALLAAEIIKTLDRDELTVRPQCQNWLRGGRPLSYPERRSRQVHGGSISVDLKPPRLASRGENPSAAHRNRWS